MSFIDHRGMIKDLLVNTECSVTYITFKKDAVRGNHYHEHTIQFDFVLKGSLEYAQDEDRGVLYKGNWIEHLPMKKHAYKALEDSEIVSICFGVRKGDNYEKDVIRLEEPLL